MQALTSSVRHFQWSRSNRQREQPTSSPGAPARPCAATPHCPPSRPTLN